MAFPRRSRILVAMEPAVLEGALALLLQGDPGTDVVQFHRATEDDRSGTYDAAIVTVGVADDVRAEVVIALPGGTASAGVGVGHVISQGMDREVQVRSHQQVIDLLVEQFPARSRRPGVLANGT